MEREREELEEREKEGEGDGKGCERVEIGGRKVSLRQKGKPWELDDNNDNNNTLYTSPSLCMFLAVFLRLVSLD